MKLVIITSNHLRHKFFSSSMAKKFEVLSILMEEKQRDPAQKGDGTEDEERIKNYFKERDKSEQDFFSEFNEIKNIKKDKICPINAGTINDQGIVNKLSKWKPDYIAVFGSSILKDKIIKLFPGRIINMHLGLSPYYRGSGTNFWPLYNEEPQYVGVTIHYLDKGIDSGKIIQQGQPEIEIGDTPHSIGNKTIKKGTELFIEILKKIERGEKIIGQDQNLKKGKLYLFKDCEPKNIIELEEKFKQGLIKKYLEKKNKEVEIVNNL